MTAVLGDQECLAADQREDEMAAVLRLPEPEQPPGRTGIPNEAEARVLAAAGLRAVRELAGRTLEEWAAEWSAALGRLITPALVETWEDPLGPKPPSHWALIAFVMGGPAAIEVSSRLLLS